MFILNNIRPASALLPANLPLVAATESKRYKILVVDDSAVQRVLCNGVLKKEYDVDLANDAEHALEMIEAGNRYDLILTDTNMPGRSGIELACVLDDKMEQLWNVRIPIVLMSDSDDVAKSVHQVLPRGVSIFVHKRDFATHGLNTIGELLKAA